MGILGLIIPALVPVVSDGIRGIFSWLTGGSGANPQNVDEAVKLMEAEVHKLQAIAQLDQPSGNISPWVADLRASFRYIAAGLIIIPAPIVALYVMSNPTQESSSFFELYVNSLAGPVFSFMFGERLRINLRK